MRTLISIMLALTALSLGDPVQADSSSTNVAPFPGSTIEISGFGDFRLNLSQPETNERFAIGQAEMALAYILNDRARSQLSLAYSDDAFAIGSFTVEYDALNNFELPSSFFKGLTLKAGQFDIPIGIDWQRYASPDRDLISTPRMVSRLHGAWNDLGMAVDLTTQVSNLAVYAANGFCFEGETAEGEAFCTENRFATGGRIGVTPISRLEVGISAARIFGKSGSSDINLAGLDLQVNLSETRLRAEIMREEFTDGIDFISDNTGYYLEISRVFGPWTLAALREQVWSRVSGEDDYSGILFGVSRQLGERLTVRCESRHDFGARETHATGQLVMQF